MVVFSLPGARSTATGGDINDLTAFYVEAQPGENIEGVRSMFLEPDKEWDFTTDATVSAWLAVRVSSGIRTLTLRMGGPDQTLPYPGTYEIATSGNERAYLNLLGLNTSSGSVGRFTVHQLEMASATEVARFAATFEIHCVGSVPGRLGEIRFHSSGIDLAAVTSSAEQLTFTAGQTQRLTVTNRGTVDQTISARLGGAFPEAFTITSNNCGLLAPGMTCNVDVRFNMSAASTQRVAELQISDQTLSGGRYTTLVGQAAP
jgi:hypothetical protein